MFPIVVERQAGMKARMLLWLLYVSGVIPHLITCQRKLLCSYLLLRKLSVLLALNVSLRKISIGRQPQLQGMWSVGFHEDWLFKGVLKTHTVVALPGDYANEITEFYSDIFFH